MGDNRNAQMVKLVCVGDGAVGKTCLLIKFVNDEFMPDHVPTVFDNHAKFITHEDQLVNMSLWDTAGQEDYARLRPLSYPHTDVFLVCYSLTSEVSLRNVAQKWVPELVTYVTKYNEEHKIDKKPPIVLVGTKMDLWKESDDPKKVKMSDVEAMVASQDMIKSHIECSSLTGDGLEDVFQESCRVALASSKPAPKKKKGCIIL